MTELQSLRKHKIAITAKIREIELTLDQAAIILPEAREELKRIDGRIQTILIERAVEFPSVA